MRRFAAIIFVAVICTVVGVATWRLSVDALALIIGVGLGFVLMTPIGGILLWMARSNAKTLQDHARHAAPQPPPVIVVQPASQPALPSSAVSHQAQPPALLPPPGYPVNLPTSSRSWDLRIFGDEQVAETQETPLDYLRW